MKSDSRKNQNTVMFNVYYYYVSAISVFILLKNIYTIGERERERAKGQNKEREKKEMIEKVNG